MKLITHLYFFLWVKGPGHEADHPPLFSAEVKNGWNYTYIFVYALMARTGTPLSFTVTVLLQQ
jgi:hypothetical protein